MTVDEVMPIFDQMRLRLYFYEDLDYFGYPTFFDNIPNDDIMRSLLTIPFKGVRDIDNNNSEQEKGEAYLLVRQTIEENYFKRDTRFKVRNLEYDRMPKILQLEQDKRYRGSISICGKNIPYSQQTRTLFQIVDSLIVLIAENTDLTLLNDVRKMELLNEVILSLLQYSLDTREKEVDLESLRIKFWEMIHQEEELKGIAMKKN